MADEALSSLNDCRGFLLKNVKFENNSKKVWKFENNAYLCSPVRKTGLERGNAKFIEKTVLLYKKQVPRNNNLSRSVNFFYGIISVRTS